MSRQDHPEDLFAERLRGAFATGCPAPELFLEAEWVRVPAAERARIEAHAATCPACAAERDLAALWDLPVDAGDLPADDIAYVVGRIEEAQSEAPAARSNVVPFPVGRNRAGTEVEKPTALEFARRPSRSLGRWGLALAAVLALGIGLSIEFRQRELPDLPAPIGGPETYRGSTVLLRGPEGELEAAPAELDWAVVEGATSYRVRLNDPLGDEIWSATANIAPLVLPAAVRAKLQTAVVYAWTVEAYDAKGDRLAGAEPLRFRISPPVVNEDRTR